VAILHFFLELWVLEVGLKARDKRDVGEVLSGLFLRIISTSPTKRTRIQRRVVWAGIRHAGVRAAVIFDWLEASEEDFNTARAKGMSAYGP
jgi:hypothetical protein